MKISHRLLALSACSTAGLLFVAAVSYTAVTSIQADLRTLTLEATPLQNKTHELQQRTERLVGALFKLTLAKGRDEVQSADQAIRQELGAIEKLGADMAALNPALRADSSDFSDTQAEIMRAVEKRLADDAAYRKESDSVKQALTQAQEAIALTRNNVNAIGVDAVKAADAAQDASRRLGNATRSALMAQVKLRELALVVNETDTVGNRFRLTPLKERLKATVDSIQRLAPPSGSEDVLKEVKAVATATYESYVNENEGLSALRAAVLANKPDAESRYQNKRKAILTPLDEQSRKLGTLTDTMEVQAFKQHQILEGALRLRNEPGGVVASSEAVALEIREVTADLRLLMLATTPADVAAINAEVGKLTARLEGRMNEMRAGLVKMGRPQFGQNVEQALAAMQSVAASVAKIAQAKTSLLNSEERMNASMLRLKSVAADKATAGEASLKSIGARQMEVVAAVDSRVDSSLLIILGAAAAIIVATGLLSVLTIRRITRSLDDAVVVAEAVSRGELGRVAAARGDDETARLLNAQARMVATLTDVVGNIRSASQKVNVGARDIVHGNENLGLRTREQSASLSETVSSVERLTHRATQNTSSAHQASSLAQSASTVAVRGGEVAGRVVATMQEIHDSSTKIADIVGVIDSIAFQTNILALNAAVEASRAGEHGRGFAVVAAEVRGLAQKTTQSAREIKDIIQASVERIEAGSNLVRSSGDTMAEIVEQVQQVSALVAEIATASQAQLAEVGQVNLAVTGLGQMTRNYAELASESTTAAKELSRQARELASAISVWRVEMDEQRPGRPGAIGRAQGAASLRLR
ncbi:methyl-accepting chemotaxis protein [Pseudoduganella namucuonensis]|uniref:Methyl-accepting chemotaxis protein n=1 Tax=Pseudoduganella namucuonensis TaxID=1035707 RepID=A0A1I7LBZ2_9BURK|nr:methyl-accepting chemotaxis protein [Pseudoduganella namucuonensis]SFV07205.1 Methyl-accepting chemotaxis protein [Pseudoduganella namucuonensis]